MRIEADIEINKRQWDGNFYMKICRAKQCLDENYWEIIKPINIEENNYIHKKHVIVLKEYTPEEYPEYYL